MHVTDFLPLYSHFSDLTLHKGEIITLLKQVDENWYEGLCNGCQGFLPANYVEVFTTRNYDPN